MFLWFLSCGVFQYTLKIKYLTPVSAQLGQDIQSNLERDITLNLYECVNITYY